MDEHVVFDCVLSATSFPVVIAGRFSVHDALSHTYFYLSFYASYVSMLM
jgi:hypothetical protein